MRDPRLFRQSVVGDTRAGYAQLASGAQPAYQFTGIATISNPNIYSVAFSGSGILYATDGSALYSIDPLTAVATFIGSLGPDVQALSGGVGVIRFDASGDLIVVAYNQANIAGVDVSELWTVNLSTGAAAYLATPLDSNGNPLIDLVPGLVSGTLYGTATQAQSCGTNCYETTGVYTYSLASLTSATALASVFEPFVPVFGANAPSPSGSSLPGPVTVFSPAQDARGVSITPILNWGAAAGATSYDLYFGTSTTPPFVTTTANLSYIPSALEPNTTYYWYLVSKNAAGSTPSVIWSFTTGTTSSHPAFFMDEISLGSGWYYLQFPDGQLFGYYNYVAASTFFHYDMGFEGYFPGSADDIYLYDFLSGHWFYTSSTLFPYLYDFTLNDLDLLLPEYNQSGPLHHQSTLFLESELRTSLLDVGCILSITHCCAIDKVLTSHGKS